MSELGRTKEGGGRCEDVYRWKGKEMSDIYQDHD